MNIKDEHRPDFPPANKNEQFRVPDHYFDRLPDAILERIRIKESSSASGKTPVLRRIYTLTAAAAVFLLLLVSGLWYHRLHQDNPVNSEDFVAGYYVAGDLIEQEDILEFIGTEDIDIDASLSGIRNDIIINYLIDEGIDETIIAEQL